MKPSTYEVFKPLGGLLDDWAAMQAETESIAKALSLALILVAMSQPDPAVAIDQACEVMKRTVRKMKEQGLSVDQTADAMIAALLLEAEGKGVPS